MDHQVLLHKLSELKKKVAKYNKDYIVGLSAFGGRPFPLFRSEFLSPKRSLGADSLAYAAIHFAFYLTVFFGLVGRLFIPYAAIIYLAILLVVVIAVTANYAYQYYKSSEFRQTEKSHIEDLEIEITADLDNVTEKLKKPEESVTAVNGDQINLKPTVTGLSALGGVSPSSDVKPPEPDALYTTLHAKALANTSADEAHQPQALKTFGDIGGGGD